MSKTEDASAGRGVVDGRPAATLPAWAERSATIASSPAGRRVHVTVDAGEESAGRTRWVGGVPVRVDAGGQPVAIRAVLADHRDVALIGAAFGPMVAEAVLTMAAPVGVGPWRRPRPRFRAGVPLGAPEPPFVTARASLTLADQVVEVGRHLVSGVWWAVRWRRRPDGDLTDPSAVPLRDLAAAQDWLAAHGAEAGAATLT